MIVVLLLAMFWGPTVIGLLFGPRPGRRSRRSSRLPHFRRSAPSPAAPPTDVPAGDGAGPTPMALPADSLHWSALDDRQLMLYLAGSAQ
jgi:hypothetical protein